MDNVVDLGALRDKKEVEAMAVDAEMQGKLHTLDIAASYHRISCALAVEYGVVEADSVQPFDHLHPVMASLIAETFEQMLEAGIIIPGEVKIDIDNEQ